MSGSCRANLRPTLFSFRCMNSLDQGRREPKLMAKLGLTRSHLSIIGLMVKAAEMKQAMQQQDANLIAQIMAIDCSLTRSSLQGDSKIASVSIRDLLRCWKAEDVSGFVLAAEGAI